MSGHPSVIFDFDDTLVFTNQIFDQAKEMLYQLLAETGVQDPEGIASYLNEADIANVHHHGYLAPECFPQAMRQTARHFAPRQPLLADRAEALGWAVYTQKTILMPQAVPVLTALGQSYRLLLWTQAEPELQQARLEKSGLLPYFSAVYICRHKNKEQLQKMIREQAVDCSRSWCVGNSLRSDINPALEAGLQAVHFAIDAWDYEQVQTVGEYQKIFHLEELLPLLRKG